MVTFDRLLVSDGALDAANWTVQYHEKYWDVAFAMSAGRDVGLVVAEGDPALAGDVVHFAPPPFDVVGRNGVAVEAFTNFPLVPA